MSPSSVSISRFAGKGRHTQVARPQMAGTLSFGTRREVASEKPGPSQVLRDGKEPKLDIKTLREGELQRANGRKDNGGTGGGKVGQRRV